MKKFLAALLILAMMVGCTACCFSATDLVEGIVNNNTVAVTIGSHQLSVVEMTYFYVDAINEYQNSVYEQFYASFGNYWSIMLGYDTSKPLNEQKYDETGKTWADYFLDEALETAKETYAIYDEAIKIGYQLGADEEKNMTVYFSSLGPAATYYGYTSVDKYLQGSYGTGANVSSYMKYYEICTIATSYMNKYCDSLVFDGADLRAYESLEDRYDNYSVVSYMYYTMSAEQYSSTSGGKGQMQIDVKTLLNFGIIDKETFDEAIQALDINKHSGSTGNLPTAIEVKRAYFDNIGLDEEIVRWLKSNERKPGDLKVFETNSDDYTIVLFTEKDDQTYKLVNVRHILVKFEGGTKDKDGKTTYSDEEKAEAKAEAEQLLAEWKAGKANEETFSELANAESDDQNGKVTNGGLYEDVYKGQMVEAFENWCFDPGRKVGDTGLVETEYGWHLMYFSSYDEMTMRDMLVEADLRMDETEEWHDALVANLTVTIHDLSKLELDRVVNTI